LAAYFAKILTPSKWRKSEEYLYISSSRGCGENPGETMTREEKTMLLIFPSGVRQRTGADLMAVD
jgi:hypothetical protein